MRHVGIPVLLFSLLLSLMLAGCGEDAPTPATPSDAQPSAQDGVRAPDALKKVISTWIEAQNAGDRARYFQITRAFVPTAAELRRMLRTGPAADAFLAAAKALTVEGSELAKEPPAKRPLRKTRRTNVFVHVASTEELAAYEKGSTASAEFPGGMRRFAQQVAAPARIWYCVEMREPGHASGTRITAFTRLGGHFFILPKPWRAMPR